jgi:general stress protein 26
VHATLSDNRSNTWATIDGTGSVRTDPDLIDDLWNPAAAAFFDDGRDTPGIAVFTIHVEQGRYWSTPSGRIGTVISMVRATLGGSDASGEQGDISVTA